MMKKYIIGFAILIGTIGYSYATETTVSFTILPVVDSGSVPVESGTIDTGTIPLPPLPQKIGFAGGRIVGGTRTGNIENLGSAPDTTTNPDDPSSVYLRATKYGLLPVSFTESSINNKITRAELAKLVTLFIQKVLGLSIPSNDLCKAKRYSDYAIMLESDKAYIESACDARVLGWNSARTEIIATYNPYKYITREQLVMIMSRMLYGNIYDSLPAEQSYRARLERLMNEKFLKNPDKSIIETYINILTFFKRVTGAIPASNIKDPGSENTELYLAYMRAKQYNITSMDTYSETGMYAPLTRQDLAHMIVMFSSNVLQRTPRPSAICAIENYTDYSTMSARIPADVKNACDLGLMGITPNNTLLSSFRPTDIVTRAELAAVLSRMIYGKTYDTTGTNEPWYASHLQALFHDGYLTKIDTPLMTERMGYVMLIMERMMAKLFPSL